MSMLQKRSYLLVLMFWCCLSACSFAADQRPVRIPLTFEPNRGQADIQTVFLARARGGTITLTNDGAILHATNQSASQSIRIRFYTATEAQILGESATGGFANYYRSQDRSQWLTHIPLYSRVRYTSMTKGIDVVFHGHEDQLEYDFEVSPGASTHDIKFAIEGADGLSIAADGGLYFASGEAAWRLLPPSAYQMHAGKRQSVRSAYRILGKGAVGFAVGPYDHSIPLIIDPVIQYSNIIGVNNNINVKGIQVDSTGNLFIAGDTGANNYPVVNGKPFQSNGSDEIYISKLDPTGNTILYSTYIPASSFSTASALALDANGNAYVAGVTSAPDFPVTSTALGSCSQFCNAGFVAKFASDGTMAYATLLSSGQALPKGIVVDGAGNAYVAGLAADNTLQTVNAFEPSFIGQICTNCTNAFFAKLNTAGTGYVFASYFADPNHTSGETFASGIGIDGSGNVFIAGQGDAPSVNPWQVGGASFIAKFAPDGKSLLFSSGLGGNSVTISAVAVGTDGTLFLAGRAGSDFPFGLSAFAHMVQDNGNGLFAAAVNPALTGFTYSNYLADGNVNAISLNSANHLFIGGSSVVNLPPLTNAVVSDLASPGFAIELDASGTPVTVTQFGGHLTQEAPTAIAGDVSGNLYVAGTISPGNESPQPDPIVVGSTFGGVTGGSFGSFFAKIGSTNAPQISLNTRPPFLFLRNAGSSDLHISSVTLGDGLATRWGNCGDTVPAGSSCVLTVADASGKLAAGTVTINSDAQPPAQTFQITLPQGAPPGSTIGDLLWFSDTATRFPPQLTGSSTATRIFTISNVGTADGAINGVFANGGVSQTNDCPAVLVAGATCTIQATVTAGAGQPSLRISYDNGFLKDFELLVPVSTQGFMVSAQAISFEVQEAMGVAIPRVVTVTNTSGTAGTPPAPSLTGDPEFTLAGNTCAASLLPHESCVVGVQFNPVIAGTRNATLSFGSQQVQLSGQGEISSVIQISPLQLNFFPVIVHRAPVTQPLTLSNASASPVGIAGFAFSLPDYSETDDCNGQVPANGSCNVQVGFSAQAVGPRDATMTINFLGGAVSQTLTLAEGVGVTPLDVTPASLDFGSALTGTVSASQGVLLGNGRQGSAQDYTLSLSGDFAITQNVCANPMPGFFGCFIQVSFEPKSAGPKSGTLTVSYPGISEQSVVMLNGTGVDTAPVVSLPATLDMGSTPVAVGIQLPLTVSNIGNADLTISGFTLSGANAADFSVAPGQCATVAAGASCAIQVGFNPGLPLQKQATMTISDNGLNNPHSVGLTGTGVGPSITLPGPTFIGQVLLGQSTTNQVLIGNAGNADLNISSLGVSGANSSEFKGNIGSCATMHAASTCLISVSFTPGVPGTRTAIIVINDNQVGSPQAFQVSGTGLGAAYSLPAALNFGNQLRGTVSSPQVISITNTGNMQLQINSGVVTGDFGSTLTGCTAVNPGASCSLSVTFFPTAAGARTGTLTLSDNTFLATHQINLSGNGTDFQLSSNGGGPPTATVAAGQTANYNLNLASGGGYTGTVTLDCSGAPQAATCTVSPATIQLQGNGTVPFTATVTTQKQVAALIGGQLFFAVFGLVAFVPLVLLSTSRRIRLRNRCVLLVFALAACLGLLGCGGGGGGGGSQQRFQTTPPGTYNLTVTATSSGVTRQINLTLIVQ